MAGQSALSSSSGLNSPEAKVGSSAGWAGSGTGANTAWPASLQPGQCVPVLLFASLCDIDRLEVATASASSAELAKSATAAAKAAQGVPLVPRTPAAGAMPGAHVAQTVGRAVEGEDLRLGRLGAGAIAGSQLATISSRPAGSEVKRKELAAAEVVKTIEKQIVAAWAFLSRQAAQEGPGDAHHQQQRPVLCRLLATGPVVVLDQRLCRRGSALRAGLSHLLGSRKAANSVDMAGASPELRLAQRGKGSRCQQALRAELWVNPAHQEHHLPGCLLPGDRASMEWTAVQCCPGGHDDK